ncbi:MAG TPA: M15 family metallopeptidase [Candidatus Obscuribacterales bacterium]
MTTQLSSAAQKLLADRRILKYKELVSVPIADNGEPLVTTSPISELSLELEDLEYPLARQSAWQRLVDAARMLKTKDKRYGIRVWYAYRSLAAQQTFFKEQRAVVEKQNPGLSEGDLLEKVHMFVAVPDVAGHPTGGAFDLTLTFEGKKVDMGCDYPDFSSPYISTFAEGLTDTQKKNRVLLREILMANGFAPFNGEWWHFSYGDREWAAFYGENAAIYSQIEADERLKKKQQESLPKLR